MKYTVTLDWEEIDGLVLKVLREDYVMAKTTFVNEPDRDELVAALLVLIRHYSAPSDYETWLETVKDL